MKKITLLFVALFSAFLVNASAGNLGEPKSVKYFYGVDFTTVNVKYARESDEELIEAFKQINYLFMTNSSMFDIEGCLNVELEYGNELDYVVEFIDSLDYYEFRDVRKYSLNEVQALSRYPKEEGLMLVIIAVELDRDVNVGEYMAVIFDGMTKEIKWKLKFKGKGKGRKPVALWTKSFVEGLNDAKMKIEKIEADRLERERRRRR